MEKKKAWEWLPSLFLFVISERSVDLYRPAQLVRQRAPLDAGQGVVQLVGDLADLAAIDVRDFVFIAQLTDRGDNRRGAGAEYLFQLAVACGLHDVCDRQALFGHRDAPVLQKIDAAHTGDARQNRAHAGRGVDRAVDLEEAVHRADFLYILVLHAVQPQGLLIAEVVRLDLRNQAGCVVAAALGKAGAARAGTGVFVLNEDLDRVDAGGIVRADRRAHDDELVCPGRANAEVRLGCNDERTDIQAGAFLMRYPVLIDRDQRLDRLDEILSRERGQAHAVVGVDHALGVFVRAEQLDRAVRRAVGFQALKRLHRVMEYHCRGIERQRRIWDDARVMPALLFIVIDDQHMIGIVIAEAKAVFVRLGLSVVRELCSDLQHGGFTLSFIGFVPKAALRIHGVKCMPVRRFLHLL